MDGVLVYVSVISTPGHEKQGYYGILVGDLYRYVYVKSLTDGRTRLEWKHHVRARDDVNTARKSTDVEVWQL